MHLRVFWSETRSTRCFFRSLKSFECDITVNNLLPLHNTSLLRAYTDLCPEAVAVFHEVSG